MPSVKQTLKHNRPAKGQEWLGEVSFYDTQVFARYCVEVAAVAKRIRGTFTQRIMRDRLGDKCLGAAETYEALARLVETCEIVQLSDVGISRWRWVGGKRQAPAARKFNGEKAVAA